MGTTLQHFRVLDARQRTKRLYTHVVGSSGTDSRALDLRYFYNDDSQIRTIIDGAYHGAHLEGAKHQVSSIQYDALNQLTRADGWWGQGTMSYDSLGNALSRDLGPNRSITHQYSSRNRLERTVDTLHHSDGGTSTRTYQHDARGNVVQMRRITGPDKTLLMAYDMTDQMVSLSGRNAQGELAVGNYTYNAEGKRASATVNGRTSYYVYEANGHLLYSHKQDDGEGVTHIRLQTGQAIATWNGASVTYLHTDHLGSPVRGTAGAGHGATAQGSTLWQDFRTPFGLTPTQGWFGHLHAASSLNPPTGMGSTAGVTGFTGHPHDFETGFTYMQARHYDPVMGQFLSIDPVGFAETGDTRLFNRYAYAGNDPINFLDPDGRKISSSSSVEENEDGTTTTTVNITFTGALQNTSSSNLSDKKLGKLADHMASQIEKSFAGSSVDENGNTTVYNTIADIVVGEATAGNERHNIEIVNSDDRRMQGFIPTIVIAGQKPDYPAGAAPIRGNDIFINQSIVSSKSAFKRTSAHEFGHSAGLLHPGARGGLPGIPQKNLMTQSRFSSSTKIVPAQLHKIANP